jgi:hypothetical protein
VKRIWIVLPVLAVAVVASALLLTYNSTRAVQAPFISLDMVPADNTYDEATNTMNVVFNPATDFCLAVDPANAATHLHQSHLIIQNVEDLVAWQVRFNFIGDQMRINTLNFTPFTDNTTGQNIAFTNLPIDTTSSLHRTITSAGGVGPAAPADNTNTPQTHLAGAVYDNTQGFAISPDTPAKTVPDDTSYSAPNGGVLAAVSLQVLGDETGNTLTMDLDDDQPNPPGSRAVIFNGSGTTDIDLVETSLADGQHVEGGACLGATPTATPSPGPTGTETPTPGPGGPGGGGTPPPGGGGTPTRTPTPRPGAATPTRAAPAALPPTGSDSDGSSGLTYVLILAALAVPVAGAVYAVDRLRRR